MTAPVTLVPEVADYLVDAFTPSMAAFSGGRIKVFDGPPTVDDIPNDFVCVMYAEEEDSSAVDGESSLSQFGNGIYAEVFAMRCQINSYTGDANLRPRRARVRAIFNELVGIVRADTTLGGLVKPPGMAELAGFTWGQDPYEDGSAVTAIFDIRVTAVLWPGG